MYEHFQFHFRHSFADLADFVQGQFPGQDHPVDALAAPEFHGGPVYGVGLHRQVDGLVRPVFPYQHDQPGVGHDQGVRLLLQHRGKVSQVTAHLVVVGRNVGDQVELFAQFVGPFNTCAQGCNVFETVVSYSQGVPWLAGVHGIGTVGKGGFQVFGGAGGRKQFREGHGISGLFRN